MIRIFRVTLSDERLYCFDLDAVSADAAIELAQAIAESSDDDPRLRELGGSFHDVVSCVEVRL